jgi:hypothetical protein
VGRCKFLFHLPAISFIITAISSPCLFIHFIFNKHIQHAFTEFSGELNVPRDAVVGDGSHLLPGHVTCRRPNCFSTLQNDCANTVLM